MKLPFLLFADKKGKIYSHPYLKMTAQAMDRVNLPESSELMLAPAESSFFYFPGRFPIGYNPKTKTLEVLSKFKGKAVFAVAAFSIPAILRLYNPSYALNENKVFPLWAYTACGFYGNKYYITAKRIDKRVRQSPRFYDSKLILKNIRATLSQFPKNRLYQHLSNCALNYNCLAAKNLFLSRWEAPLPTAKACNARCSGCLSDQASDCLSSHGRIKFTPSAKEIFEVAYNHLKVGKEAIVSFGQGCEGEPLLASDTIAKSIYLLREKTDRGTININTNASLPKKVKLLCLAGMDSFRVSLNSPVEKNYNLYFRPQGYKFKDVLASIAMAKKHNKFVSLNLFVFPGFTDSETELKALIKFIKNNGIDMIQWRNLNIDPQHYLNQYAGFGLEPQGMLLVLETVRKKFPKLEFGYFNLPKEDF